MPPNQRAQRSLGPFSQWKDSEWAPATTTPRTQAVQGVYLLMLPSYRVVFTNTGGANLLISNDGVQFTVVQPGQSASFLSPTQITLKSAAGEVPWTATMEAIPPPPPPVLPPPEEPPVEP